jgi:hypothetical protein
LPRFQTRRTDLFAESITGLIGGFRAARIFNLCCKLPQRYGEDPDHLLPRIASFTKYMLGLNILVLYTTLLAHGSFPEDKNFSQFDLMNVHEQVGGMLLCAAAITESHNALKKAV